MKICEIPALFGEHPLFLVVTERTTYNVRAVDKAKALRIIEAHEASQ